MEGYRGFEKLATVQSKLVILNMQYKNGKDALIIFEREMCRTEVSCAHSV